MKSFKLFNIFDYIFVNIIIFLPLLMWFKYLTKNSLLSFFISFFLLIPINLIYSYFSNKKQINNKISSKLKKDIDDYTLSLLSNSQKENLVFFSNIFKTQDLIITYKNNMFSYKEKNKKILYCPLFEQENLTFEIAIKQIAIAKKLGANEIILLCINVDTKTKIKLESLIDVNLKIFNKYDIYQNIFKKYNTYPVINFSQKEKTKFNIKFLYQISFQKTNAKKYFLSGIFLFFCSFFIRNNIYYILFSSISFFLCLLCFVNNSKLSQK